MFSGNKISLSSNLSQKKRAKREKEAEGDKYCLSSRVFCIDGIFILSQGAWFSENNRQFKVLFNINTGGFSFFFVVLWRPAWRAVRKTLNTSGAFQWQTRLNRRTGCGCKRLHRPGLSLLLQRRWLVKCFESADCCQTHADTQHSGLRWASAATWC